MMKCWFIAANVTAKLQQCRRKPYWILIFFILQYTGYAIFDTILAKTESAYSVQSTSYEMENMGYLGDLGTCPKEIFIKNVLEIFAKSWLQTLCFNLLCSFKNQCSKIAKRNIAIYQYSRSIIQYCSTKFYNICNAEIFVCTQVNHTILEKNS